MSVKLVKKKEIDEEKAAAFAASLGVLKPVAEVLISRDVDTIEKAEKFLNPKLSDMQNPFDIKGIAEGVERLKTAIERDESIVVFGDYDCDGLCALASLVLELRKTNSKVSYFVPRRDEDGYGLSVSALDSIVAEYNPSLIVSVDCGITTVKEVEYIKSRGIDCIITDHHEPQGKIPDCIVIDAKVEKKGYYDYCGAGIVFKLIEALKGIEVALEYVGIAALATVADMVPLTGDNRIIVRYGLDKINDKSRAMPVTNILCDFLGITKVTSKELANQFAPRINSSGRLGDAAKTLEVFFVRDEDKARRLLERLNNDNNIRKERCDLMIAAAMEKLRTYDFAAYRVIVLRDDAWDTGMLGIAASKLAEVFHRPTILFTNKTGELRGSARTTPSINVFELLSEFNDMYLNYGGHQSAVGLTLKPDSITEFTEKVNAKLFATTNDLDYAPIFFYDTELDVTQCTLELSRQFAALEPLGFGNPRPYFKLKNAGKLNFMPVKNTTHVKAKIGAFELIGYDYRNALDVYRGDLGIIFTLHEKTYNGREQLLGIIKMYYLHSVERFFEDALLMLSVAQVSSYDYKFSRKLMTIGKHDNVMQNSMFGTLFIALNESTYELFLFKARSHDNFIINNVRFTKNANPYNRIVLMPGYEYDFRYFNRIVFLDKPISEGYYELVHRLNPKAQLYLADDAPLQDAKKIAAACPTDAEIYDLYKIISQIVKRNRTTTRYDIIGLVKSQYPSFELFKITASLKTLFEAEAIVYSAERSSYVSNNQFTLSDSDFYRQMQKLKKDVKYE